MTTRLAARVLCTILTVLIALPPGFGQTPVDPTGKGPLAPGAPLTIVVLEGNKAINSTSLLRSIAPVVEIRDRNEFPVEGATVTFTLPATGTGGTFTGAGAIYTTRSDSHGQATTSPFIPRSTGKFHIKVTATSGTRSGEVEIEQTNSSGSYSGQPFPPPAWYKRRRNHVIAAAAVGGIITLVILLRRGSGDISVTPGVPVFH